jgi:hypothetical protein
MGASGKTLARIEALVHDGHLHVGARVAELGTQQLHAQPVETSNFLRFFRDRGVAVSMTEAKAAETGRGGFLGSLLKAVGFGYVALDIFDAPDTRLLDLNTQFVPDDLRSSFDLVTNYGTTEHVLNQMLAMRSIHDLAKPKGLIHHDLPMGGYYLHCYFAYRPAVLHDLASANGYQLVFQEVSSGSWRPTPDVLRKAGFAENEFRDYGLEMIFKKQTGEPFRIPVDNIGSVTISDAAWRSDGRDGVVVSPVLPADPETLLARLPFRILHAAYWSRLRWALRDRIKRRK